MGCDIGAFLEIEGHEAGEFDSLYNVDLSLPRHYALFDALTGFLGQQKPLFPFRGVPSGLGVYGFSRCYRPIVEPCDILSYRGGNIILPYEIGRAEVLPQSISPRWGLSKLGYVISSGLEMTSWLSLSEIRQALDNAGLQVSDLPPEYDFVFQTMNLAELMLHRHTRMVFWLNC